METLKEIQRHPRRLPRLMISVATRILSRPIAVAALAQAFPGPAEAQVRWVVNPVPVFSAASTDEEGGLRFSEGTWAIRLPDGGIAVADGADGAVVLIDARGLVRARIGRKGRGPQEFVRPTWLGRCGSDSLFVWDAMGASLSVVVAGAGVVKRTVVPGTFSQRDVGCSSGSRFLIPTSSGRVAGAASATGVSANGIPYEVRWGQYAIVLRNREGNAVFEMPNVPHAEFLVGRVLPGDNPNNFVRPLGGRLLLASTTTGFVRARSDSGIIHVHGLDGTQQRSFSVRRETEPLAREEWRDAVLAESENLPAQLRPYFEPFAQGTEPPRTRPAINGMWADATGLLWIQRSLPGTSPTEFSVFTMTGEERARVRLAEPLIAFEIGADYIIGRVQSEDGEETIRVWRYSRSR